MPAAPSLFRIILQVENVDRAAAFYGRLLGDEGRRIHPHRHYVDCGPVILALIDPSQGGTPARPLPDHVYFAVSDLEAVHARARELGALAPGEVHGTPAGEILTRPWGERSFYVRDPFGNPLCFVDETTLFTGR